VTDGLEGSGSWWSRTLHRLRRDIWVGPDENFAHLDGLRGFASCIIVFYHCAIFTAFFTPEAVESGRGFWVRVLSNGFWSGIDIFFVLSGFLIGRILISNLVRDGVLYYGAFLLRRSFRIFPAYYFMLTVSLLFVAPLGLPIFHFLYGTEDWNLLFRESWSNYFYLVNYVNPGNEPSIMSWGWSLAVEEHFYLILPPVLWLLFRSSSSAVRLWGLIACVLIPLAGRAFQYLRDPSIELMDGFYYYSHNRFDSIFMGVVISYLYVLHFEDLRRFCLRAGSALAATGLACVAIVWIAGGLHRGGLFVIVFQFFIMGLGTSLLVLNGLFLDNGLTRVLQHPRWYPVARISYGVYLIHPFVLFFLLHFYRQRVPTGDIGGGLLVVLYILVVALSSMLAVVMFEVLELPMLRLGARVSARSRQWQRQRRASQLLR